MKELLPIPKLFADTSNVQQLEKLIPLGLFSGITTNPTIVAKESQGEPLEAYRKLTKMFPDIPISIQLLDEDVKTLIVQAKMYRDISPNVVVKVPMFKDARGIKLISELTKLAIPTNVTALMTAEQALLALIAGSTEGKRGPNYVSLFFNRIKDGGSNPNGEIKRTRLIIDTLELHSEIITGSIRQGKDVFEAFLAGTHIVTVPPNRFWEMVFHEKSTEFIRECQKNWEDFIAGSYQNHSNSNDK